MMTPSAKQSLNTRKSRRTLPSAERRLRASFPEVWAWYELIVAAREGAPLAEPVREPETTRRRSAQR
jgi:hypothetical protein